MAFADLFSLRNWLSFLFCYLVFMFLVIFYVNVRDLFNRISDLAVAMFDDIVWNFDELEYDVRLKKNERSKGYYPKTQMIKND